MQNWKIAFKAEIYNHEKDGKFKPDIEVAIPALFGADIWIERTEVVSIVLSK
jgi:hypothetical protein